MKYVGPSGPYPGRSHLGTLPTCPWWRFRSRPRVLRVGFSFLLIFFSIFILNFLKNYFAYLKRTLPKKMSTASARTSRPWRVLTLSLSTPTSAPSLSTTLPAGTSSRRPSTTPSSSPSRMTRTTPAVSSMIFIIFFSISF